MSTSLFRKKTYTGLLTNFYSFTSFKCKVGLVKTLIDRTFKINSSWTSFHTDIVKVETTLKRNEFPDSLLDTHVKTYLNKCFKTKKVTQEITSPRFYKLPYIGSFSSYTQKKIDIIVNRYCKQDVIIKLVFTPLKLASMFSTKDQIPLALKSSMVYKFVCKGCNA